MNKFKQPDFLKLTKFSLLKKNLQKFYCIKTCSLNLEELLTKPHTGISQSVVY